jgi:hypothetical protein
VRRQRLRERLLRRVVGVRDLVPVVLIPVVVVVLPVVVPVVVLVVLFVVAVIVVVVEAVAPGRPDGQLCGCLIGSFGHAVRVRGVRVGTPRRHHGRVGAEELVTGRQIRVVGTAERVVVPHGSLGRVSGPADRLLDGRSERVPFRRPLGLRRWRGREGDQGLLGLRRRVRAPRPVVGLVHAQLDRAVQRRGVVARYGALGGQHLDRRRGSGPFEGRAQLVGEHVGRPRAVVQPDEDDRVREGTRRGARGREPAGEQHAAAGERARREIAQRAGDRVLVVGGGEPMLGAILRLGRREGGRWAEVGAGRRDQRRTHRRRQHRPGGDEARGEHLDGTGVLAEGDQLARPVQQIVVDPPGQCQQQVVRRPLRLRVVHLAPSPRVGRSPHAPTSAVADRHSGLDPMMAAWWYAERSPCGGSTSTHGVRSPWARSTR